MQIHQGFQIDLGNAELKLKENQVELQSLKRELAKQQEEHATTSAKLIKTQDALSQLKISQDWLHQIKIPIKLVEIKKTLPKQDFETLWGFSILSPQTNFVIQSGAIVVKGWVLGKKSQAQTIQVIHDGAQLLETAVKLRRPMVIQQYPDIPTAKNSGFEFSLSVAGISTITELSIETILEDKTRVPLCNLILQPIVNEAKNT